KESIQRLNLTDMEKQCLQSLINGLYAEAGFSDVDATDISEWTGISIKSVRGVLANLVKKGLITIEDNGAGYQIIYLRPEWYNLHSQRWVEEIKHWRSHNFQQATQI
ncbi:MAG: hypothetical protein ACK518_00770, partial [bacterium]